MSNSKAKLENLQRRVAEAEQKLADAKETLTALEEEQNAAEHEEEDSEEEDDENLDVAEPRFPLTPNVPASIVEGLQAFAQARNNDLPNDVQQAMILLHSFLESSQ